MHILSFLDPHNSRNIKQSTFDQVEELLPLTFNKVAVKLEHLDISNVTFSEADAVKFWINVYNMKSPMGDYKYRSLATVGLKLLAIPTSNADCERVFSHVRRIKTDFRSSLSPTTISSLIGCHFNKVTKCCEQTKFEESSLAEQNSVHMKEISRISHLSSPIAFL